MDGFNGHKYGGTVALRKEPNSRSEVIMRARSFDVFRIDKKMGKNWQRQVVEQSTLKRWIRVRIPKKMGNIVLNQNNQIQENTRMKCGPHIKISPVLECVNNTGTTCVSYWGYMNPEDTTQQVPKGPHNMLVPPTGPQIQPTTFLPGRHYKVFRHERPCSSGNLVWKLTTKTGTATNRANYVTCTSDDHEDDDDDEPEKKKTNTAWVEYDKIAPCRLECTVKDGLNRVSDGGIVSIGAGVYPETNKLGKKSARIWCSDYYTPDTMYKRIKRKTGTLLTVDKTKHNNGPFILDIKGKRGIFENSEVRGCTFFGTVGTGIGGLRIKGPNSLKTRYMFNIFHSLDKAGFKLDIGIPQNETDGYISKGKHKKFFAHQNLWVQEEPRNALHYDAFNSEGVLLEEAIFDRNFVLNKGVEKTTTGFKFGRLKNVLSVNNLVSGTTNGILQNGLVRNSFIGFNNISTIRVGVDINADESYGPEENYMNEIGRNFVNGLPALKILAKNNDELKKFTVETNLLLGTEKMPTRPKDRYITILGSSSSNGKTKLSFKNNLLLAFGRYGINGVGIHGNSRDVNLEDNTFVDMCAHPREMGNAITFFTDSNDFGKMNPNATWMIKKNDFTRWQNSIAIYDQKQRKLDCPLETSLMKIYMNNMYGYKNKAFVGSTEKTANVQAAYNFWGTADNETIHLVISGCEVNYTLYADKNVKSPGVKFRDIPSGEDHPHPENPINIKDPIIILLAICIPVIFFSLVNFLGRGPEIKEKKKKRKFRPFPGTNSLPMYKPVTTDSSVPPMSNKSNGFIPK